jgi:uncharacterized protein YkuJ
MVLLSLGAINKLTNEYVYPKIADKKSMYKCCDCEDDLVLCQGPIKAHYFRHKVKNRKCKTYTKPSESEIHRDAKLLIKKLLESHTPISINRTCKICNKKECFDIPEMLHDSNIILEYRFDCNGPKVADVAYIENNEILCIFEICHSHQTSEEVRPNNIPWFEIIAKDLINLVNNGNNNDIDISKLPRLYLNCNRYAKCNNCIENCIDDCIDECIDNDIETNNKPTFDIKNYVQTKLYDDYVQTKLYDDQLDYDDHVLDFDARDYTQSISNNKRVMNLFSNNFLDKDVVIHTSEGYCDILIVSKIDHKIYNYWDRLNRCSWITHQLFPSEEHIHIHVSSLRSNTKKYKDDYDSNKAYYTVIVIIFLINKCRQLYIDKLHNEDRVYLSIKYHMKDMLKDIGGNWDWKNKLWYVHKNIYVMNESYINFLSNNTILYDVKYDSSTMVHNKKPDVNRRRKRCYRKICDKNDDINIDFDSLPNMKKHELISICKKYSIKVSGSKQELINFIIEKLSIDIDGMSDSSSEISSISDDVIDMYNNNIDDNDRYCWMMIKPDIKYELLKKTMTFNRIYKWHLSEQDKHDIFVKSNICMTSIDNIKNQYITMFLIKDELLKKTTCPDRKYDWCLAIDDKDHLKTFINTHDILNMRKAEITKIYEKYSKITTFVNKMKNIIIFESLKNISIHI